MLKKVFFAWLPLACLLTLVCVFGYALVQQDLRQSANDPQIQIAEDGAAKLLDGAAATVVAAAPVVDISKSLSPFTIVFGDDGHVISSSATLNGTSPIPPNGVFGYSRALGEDRFTWEPQSGVRIAAVVERVSGPKFTGFILSGRSLKEVEKREDQTSMIALSAWVFGMVGLFVVEIVVTAFA